MGFPDFLTSSVTKRYSRYCTLCTVYQSDSEFMQYSL